MKPRRIVVDLTPLSNNGQTGGAKPMVLELIQQLIAFAPQDEFFLLTSESNHDGLAYLETENAQRLCVAKTHQVSGGFNVRPYFHYFLAKILPGGLLRKVKQIYNGLRNDARQTGIVRTLEADLLFCPFTAPLYYDPQTPVISIIYDLQFITYPHFFNPLERLYRQEHFQDAWQLASHLIAISDYVRQSVLANSDITTEKVSVIHPGIHSRLTLPSEESKEAVLTKWNLKETPYLFFPANFWQHKNHALLLEALTLYCQKNPSTDLKLLCTGSPGEDMERVALLVRRLGLDEKVILAGYLPKDEFTVLFANAKALIFPSLYEGYGIPILEAMYLGIPVLCSNVTALPEVAGEAAIFFDPLSPNEMASAIEKLVNDPELCEEYVQRGKARLEQFYGPREMARRYYQIFQKVLD